VNLVRVTPEELNFYETTVHTKAKYALFMTLNKSSILSYSIAIGAIRGKVANASFAPGLIERASWNVTVWWLKQLFIVSCHTNKMSLIAYHYVDTVLACLTVLAFIYLQRK
jgi:hypothetical protein